MSRTIRRNKPHLIHLFVRPIEDSEQWFNPNVDRYPQLTPQQNYDRSLHRFTRDRHSGIHSAPRQFRHERFNDRMRRAERDEIRRCLQRDEWDDHLTGHHPRGARGLWFWLM